MLSPSLPALIHRLETEIRDRAATLGYERDAAMTAGFGMTKYDCGLVITEVGQHLGYRVHGLADWRDPALFDIARFPGHINPDTNGGEEVIPYLYHPRSRCDYAWFDRAGACVAVFETDGRDNCPSVHLPETPRGCPVVIREHKSTNNLFKLTPAVLEKRFGQVPPLRAWILFSVDNKTTGYRPKNPPTTTIAAWAALFDRCEALKESKVMADTGLLQAGSFSPLA